uniref:Uncharacterized protein n=1 Tax=Physcomitrium patens TaxID=3218 RepID=A0A2K1KVA6_PHYPA|nr:hypothetical protein PHYPA_004692 [Physcomitrium patens]PNR57701.1 hypothetical protein PHYPA_004695 [Physcomitrium patens]
MCTLRLVLEICFTQAINLKQILETLAQILGTIVENIPSHDWLHNQPSGCRQHHILQRCAEGENPNTVERARS